jgi:hypothetical protein
MGAYIPEIGRRRGGTYIGDGRQNDFSAYSF